MAPYRQIAAQESLALIVVIVGFKFNPIMKVVKFGIVRQV
jgi:hypothetical protein